jgi:hypothetical protein
MGNASSAEQQFQKLIIHNHWQLFDRPAGEARLENSGIKRIEVHPCEQYCSEMH